MEVDKNSGLLRTILSAEEVEAIPEASAKKIEEEYYQKLEQFITAKALFETRKTELENNKAESERKIEELTLKVQEESSKHQFSQQTVKELSIGLEDVKQELIKTKERLAHNDVDTARFRQERDAAVEERDTLLSMVERKTIEIERLQADVLSLEARLKASHLERCEALLKYEEIKGKEQTLEHKEKRMDRELSIRDNQITRLTQDLDAAMQELQNLRRQQNVHSLTVDARLAEKIEDLKIANKTIAQLTERNCTLTAKVDDLADKNMHLANEITTMMDTYRKQIDSQTTLCNLLQEDKDDTLHQVKELESYIIELRQMLDEATKTCGELETKQKQLVQEHTDALDEKQKQISDLQAELKVANQLLEAAKGENLEHAIEQLAPTAAATSRMIKTGMSLTEVYSLYVRTSEELHKEQKEHNKKKIQLDNIIQELEQSAPKIARQYNENMNLTDMNRELTEQLNKMISEAGEWLVQKSSLENEIENLKREIKNLLRERKDLCWQVCNLLGEEARTRNGNDSVQLDGLCDFSGNFDIHETITRTLGSFSTIEEMHSNYMKLLLVVHDLSEKITKGNELQQKMDQITKDLERDLEAGKKHIEQLEDNKDKQQIMLEQVTQQRNRYQKMLQDMLSSANHAGSAVQLNQTSMNGTNSFADSVPMDGVDNVPLANSSAVVIGPSQSEVHNATIIAEKERKIDDLQGRLKELQKEMGTLKEEYETYRREKLTNEKMLNEQFDQMRGELRELTCKNVQLMGTIEFNSGQNKMMANNIVTYKQQIQTLEERNKNYEITIGKHEATVMYLQNEAMSAQSKLARAEVQLENLKQECHILKGTEARLQSEREILNRERQNQHLLLNNLEMIKLNMERSENEGRLRLESRLDATSRECSALRSRLQEEQDRFREQASTLQRQAETARKRMEEEIAISETVQAEMKNLRDELEIKSRKIDDLQRKLQQTLSPDDENNPVTKANRRARELEQQLNESRAELESALTELATAKEHVKQYAELSESSEKELKDLNEVYSRYRETSEAELVGLRKREEEFNAQINELKTEVSLKITGAQLTAPTSDKNSELHKAQLELKEALEKLAEQNRELREMREKCQSLLEQVDKAEAKYASEMVQHSSDIQQLAQLKEEMSRLRSQFDELVQGRDRALERLKAGEESWSNREQMLRTDMAQLEERLENLNSQNSALHDQIQCLSARLSVSTVPLNQSSTATADDSMSEGASAECTMLNRSLTEEEKQSVDQLVLIIKYLRKEKDIAVARFDLLRSENVRIQSELMMFQKKCEEAQAELAAAREKTDTGMVTIAKHEEILRKLETYNAITDSNRVLREERDGLVQEVKAQSERLLKVQDELFPLQEKVRELTVRFESATNENAALRVEATRWRQRANLLVERSNKTNPDDWKRMQAERENLAKMLTAEKEQHKQANDELHTVKQERTRLETELANVNKQLAAGGEQLKKLTAEMEASIAQATVKLTAEVESLKTELKTKDDQLLDAKNKEQQIRKIAKRYKDSYFELKKEMDEKATGTSSGATGTADVTAGATVVAAGGEAEARSTLASGALEAEIAEIRKKLESAVEEVDTLQKENELLRSQLEKAERNQELLKDAKHRIMSLTEQKNNAVRELSTVKGQMQQQLDQVREENDLLKSQYEGRMSRFEKDSADADRESKEAIARLSRENEQMVIRLNQLNRQLGLQQVAKPSTSAVGAGGSEKPVGESPRTANVKPMAGPSNQQSAAVTPRRVSETPLASIRPMAVGSRTAAVLPTSQSTTNVAIVQGSSSTTSSTAAAAAAVAGSSGSATTTGTLPTVSGSAAGTVGVAAAAANSAAIGSASGSAVSGGPSSGGGSGSGPSTGSGSSSTCGLTTALVPPQQQVHSVTATSSSGSSTSSSTSASGGNLSESMASSSPTSSHTDYMPATSSASVAVAAVPPMGTASTSTNAAESSSSSSSSTSQMVEGDSAPQMGSSSSSSSTDPAHQQQAPQVTTQQAAVAMVLPQVEGGVSQQHQAQQQHQVQQQQQQQQPQSQVQQQQQQQTAPPQLTQQQQLLQSAPQASSSNTVTTTQAALKRPRDVEGDSSTDTVSQQSTSKPAPAKKRLRIGQVAGEAFQGVSESGLDVEYQVPTSSQRDQEDDIIVVDTEEEEEEEDDDEEDEDEEEDVGMADEGTAEADDGPYEGYEAEESYEQEGQGVVAPGVGPYDEGEGPDIDEDNNIQPSANNEVDVDEDNEVPNACGTTSTTSTSTSSTSSQSAKLLLHQHQQQQQQPMDTADVETSSTSSTTTTTTPGGSAATAAVLPSTSGSPVADGGSSVNDASQQPQIQSTTGSLGSGGSGTAPLVVPAAAASSSSTAEVAGSSNAATTRQVVNPLSRQQQQAAHLMLMQQQSYEHEGADDRIVPSTPTLYVPRRTDGFSEAVSSPHPQVPNARFTFGESSSSSRQSVGVVPTSGGAGESDGSVGNNADQEMLPAGIDDTRIDLSQLDEGASGGSSSVGRGRSVPTTPHHTTGESSSSSAAVISSCVVTSLDRSEQELLEEDDDDTTGESSNAVDDGTAVGVNERANDNADVDMLVGQASVSQRGDMPVPSTAPASSVGAGPSSATAVPSSAVGPSSGDDGVSSQGEKRNTAQPMEEGREAEVLGATSSNITRALRSSTTTTINTNIPHVIGPNRRGRRPGGRGTVNRSGNGVRAPITFHQDDRRVDRPPRGRRSRGRY